MLFSYGNFQNLPVCILDNYSQISAILINFVKDFAASFLAHLNLRSYKLRYCVSATMFFDILTDEKSLSCCFIESVYSLISSDPRQPMPDLFERTTAMMGGPVAAEEVEDDEEGDGEEDAVAVAAGVIEGQAPVVEEEGADG